MRLAATILPVKPQKSISKQEVGNRAITWRTTGEADFISSVWNLEVGHPSIHMS
jgi:hypothetical protein